MAVGNWDTRLRKLEGTLSPRLPHLCVCIENRCAQTGSTLACGFDCGHSGEHGVRVLLDGKGCGPRPVVYPTP